MDIDVEMLSVAGGVRLNIWLEDTEKVRAVTTDDGVACDTLLLIDIDTDWLAVFIRKSVCDVVVVLVSEVTCEDEIYIVMDFVCDSVLIRIGEDDWICELAIPE